MSLAANDPRHGTYNGYTNHGCRCEACCKAHTRYIVERRHRLGIAKPRDLWKAEVHAAAEARDNHGTETRYQLGCRCDECRGAAAAARRQRRHANPDTTRVEAERKRRWRAQRKQAA